MECLNCGCVIELGTEICPNCGDLVADDTSEDERISPRNSALSVLKNPLYMIVGFVWLICFSLCVADFVYSFNSLSTGSFVYEWISNIRILRAERIVRIVSFSITGIPILLNTIGFIVSAFNARKGECGGLGCLKAGSIVSMIITSLLLVIIVVACVFIGIQVAGHTDFGIKVNPVFWVTMGLIIVMVVLTIVFFAKTVTTLSIVQDAVNQDKTYCKTSVFAAIMCCFWAILIMFLTISRIKGETGNILSVVFLSSYALSFLLMGISMLMFRKIEVSYGQDERYKRVSYGGMRTPPTDYGRASGEVRYCGFCGGMVVGTQPCSCGGESRLRKPPSTPKSSSMPETAIAGGLRSTMRSGRTAMAKKSVVERDSISAVGKSRSYFDNAGNLD